MATSEIADTSRSGDTNSTKPQGGGRPDESDDEPTPSTTESPDYRSAPSLVLCVWLFVLAILLVDSTIHLWPNPIAGSATRDALERRSLALEAQVHTVVDSITKLRAAATNDTAVARALHGEVAALAEVQPRADIARYFSDSVSSAAAASGIVREPIELLFGLIRLPDVSIDLRLVLLSMLMGAVGAYAHVLQSFASYVGNRTFRNSWLPWYAFRPLLGATLGAALYFAIRGSLFPSTALVSADVSPFGVAALGVVAGMFSKQATDKLNEVFTTLFRTSAHGEIANDAQRVDKLPPGPGQVPATVVSGAAASGGTASGVGAPGVAAPDAPTA